MEIEGVVGGGAIEVVMVHLLKLPDLSFNTNNNYQRTCLSFGFIKEKDHAKDFHSHIYLVLKTL